MDVPEDTLRLLVIMADEMDRDLNRFYRSKHQAVLDPLFNVHSRVKMLHEWAENTLNGTLGTVTTNATPPNS